MNTCLQSFEPYLLANKKTEKPILHVSLNPDPKDVLTDQQLTEIAQIYMQKMGYGNQPFIVYKHGDIERKHLHIVSLRVDETGKKIDHNFEHRRSMDVCRELEQKYGLVPADQKQLSPSSQQSLKPINPEKGNTKRQIANVIRTLARDYHFLSLKEYKALLALYNIGMEEIRGEAKGNPYQGIVYFALTGNGEKTGAPFKSSLFGKTVGVEALEKRIEKSAEVIKDKRLKERSKTVISAAMRSTRNRRDFEAALSKQNITAIFRTNDDGRIYGATFIDHEQKCVFNGSRLGKEFSANVFHNLFNDATARPQSVATPTPNENQRNFVPDMHPNFSNSFVNGFSEKDSAESAIGSIFNIFSPAGSATDYEEEAFTHRMKKRKKKPQKRL